MKKSGCREHNCSASLFRAQRLHQQNQQKNRMVLNTRGRLKLPSIFPPFFPQSSWSNISVITLNFKTILLFLCFATCSYLSPTGAKRKGKNPPFSWKGGISMLYRTYGFTMLLVQKSQGKSTYREIYKLIHIAVHRCCCVSYHAHRFSLSNMCYHWKWSFLFIYRQATIP